MVCMYKKEFLSITVYYYHIMANCLQTLKDDQRRPTSPAMESDRSKPNNEKEMFWLYMCFGLPSTSYSLFWWWHRHLLSCLFKLTLLNIFYYLLFTINFLQKLRLDIDLLVIQHSICSNDYTLYIIQTIIIGWSEIKG